MIYLFSMVSFFASTCPIRSGVGAIDNPDWFEQAVVQYYIPKDPENFFTHDISMVRRQKMTFLTMQHVVDNLEESASRPLPLPNGVQQIFNELCNKNHL